MPHLLNLKTGAVSEGFSEGRGAIGGMRAEGAIQSWSLDLFYLRACLQAADLDHAGLCKQVLHNESGRQ